MLGFTKHLLFLVRYFFLRLKFAVQYAVVKPLAFLTETVLHGKVMHNVGVETIGVGALKLTSFLKEQMQQKNIYFGSLYTVRTLKEVIHYAFSLGLQSVSYVGFLYPPRYSKSSYQCPCPFFFT